MRAKKPIAQGSADVPQGVSIVVDAAGGDAAPAAPVAGGVSAARRFPDTTVVLVGPEDRIAEELENNGRRPDNIRVLPASQSIGMHESPVQAFREKEDSSLAVGIAEVAAGKADAFVSAGNTGAVVAASTLGLGLIDGVQRPGIAVPIVALDHAAVIIDAGANIHCKPAHLLQYGLMATVFARDVLRVDNPRVGLLNVGHERRKGTSLLRQAFDLLSRAPINFRGNVEARGIFFGECDIAVCEGFAGNVLLKTCESVVAKLLEHLRVEIKSKWRRRVGFALCGDVFKPVEHYGDYAQYGGAPLLGIKGVTIICHGHSDGRAIENAVREARSFIRRRVNEKIAEVIRTSPLSGDPADAPLP